MTKGRGSSSSSSNARGRSVSGGSGGGRRSDVVSIRSAEHDSVVAEAVGRAKECHLKGAGRADRFGRSSADLTFHFAGTRAVVRAHR